MRKAIVLVTLLIFVYNALFAYVVIQFTSGPARYLFLVLLSFDYIIIFYFVRSVVAETRKLHKHKRRKG